jgi:cobalt/nickel transport protein
MPKSVRVFPLLFLMISVAVTASAHYGMIIPSDTMVMQEENRTVSLQLSFSHPFERIGMALEKPKTVTVTTRGNRTSLLTRLQKTTLMDGGAWEAEYGITRPGVYIFFMEPRPYWEPAEDSYIIHYTKTVVAAFGDDEGWDAELGVPTEIVPLAKPFGQYAGNVFQGIVKLHGKPVPFAEVEVEYFNEDGRAVAPTDYMITQTIKADPNGIFTYAVPRPGWWGFAALNSAPYKLKHDNADKDVELGAVIWIKFEPWTEN